MADVFERYTDRARQVIVLSQKEARSLNHNYIATEHILLGLIREGEAVAAQVLVSLGITLPEVRAQVEEIVGRGNQQAASDYLPFTPRAAKVLQLSEREALQLGVRYIGTEHILLGLIREGEGVGAQILQNLGLDLSRVRQAVLQKIAYTPPGQADKPMPPMSRPARPSQDYFLVAHAEKTDDVSVKAAIAYFGIEDIGQIRPSKVNSTLQRPLQDLQAEGIVKFVLTASERHLVLLWWKDLQKVIALQRSHPLARFFAAIERGTPIPHRRARAIRQGK